MATTPGILTDWPWQPLGSFKHIVLAPWVVGHGYSYLVKGGNDLSTFLIFPLILWRMLHNQIWISLSRYRTAKGNTRILDKPIEFDQVDREKNWDDQIILNGFLFYFGMMLMPQHLVTHLPVWRTDGIIMALLLHAGPVEFLYYWLHRLLHHHFLYSRYHSHHHSSIVTEPITSVIHPFAEHLAYFFLFSIPVLTTLLTGTASIFSFIIYVTYIDFMNNMGHCNFELIPKWLFTVFPPLKYIIYTPSFHSLHHTQFRTNYSLFMPFYDYIYGTMDTSTDTVYEISLKRQEDVADVVYLTHLTTPESIYHLRFGFAHFASNPLSSKWYLWLLWPVTLLTVALTWVYGRTFVVERHRFDKLRLQTWAIPKYKIQYYMKLQTEAINNMIEKAILEANEKSVKVLSLGLLNQAEEVNRHGEIYVERHPELKTKIVDGSSLAVAVVVNSIPKGTTQLLLTGKLSKVACAVALSLCRKGIQVAIPFKEDYEKLRELFGTDNSSNNMLLSSNYSLKTWLASGELSEKKQKHAKAGTIFIPVSQFPLKKFRKDCLYYTTPAMEVPPSLENVDSCENWLPRRVMSVWRIAGIVHCLEGWNVNECGSDLFDVDKVWEATLKHGFKPLVTPPASVSPKLC
ncbi:very-long-chain aldehyde decarbonylase CER1-like [Euphorbia lathyris]|uniref:very-long-chain aldehyde decarbonylase CER1-like n=1 Tax=Euphorbia lathyris TaxID=212925 RepID=UPI00331430A8